MPQYKTQSEFMLWMIYKSDKIVNPRNHVGVLQPFSMVQPKAHINVSATSCYVVHPDKLFSLETVFPTKQQCLQG